MTRVRPELATAGWCAALIVALGAALAAAPAGAYAQVRGQVIDPSGRPLPGVLVELWDSARRIGGDGTNPTGQFRVPAPPPTGPRVLLARGIGLDPLRRTLGPRDSVVILVMQPHAIELAAATVIAGAFLCPDRDDARARVLWEHAASHYDVSLSAYGVQTDVRVFAALVPPESLGVIDTARLEMTFIGGRYSALAFATRFTSAPNYYAVRAGRSHPRRFGRWSYQLLESSRSWHFADTFFASMNRLALEPDPAGDTAITFCSSDRDRPSIRGRLHLAPDSTMASAEWEFVTPAPREEAGGRVVFAPADPRASGQPLMPIAGLYWRKVLGEVYEEWMEYRQWYRCENSVSCVEPQPLQGGVAEPPGSSPPGPPQPEPRGGAPSGPTLGPPPPAGRQRPPPGWARRAG